MEADSTTFSVLHVDDDQDFADLTAEMLETNDARFNVESVTSASDGLARFTEDDATFDCIVSDHDMPGRNGIEFLEAVRERDDDTPFILFTGKGSEEVASEAISVGVTDYLQKGGGTDQYGILANRIRNNIERTRAERAREELRERMELALKHTDSVIFELDLDSGVVRGQGQFAQFTHDFPDGDLSWRDYCEYVVHPDDHAAFQGFFEEVMCGERDSGAIEYRTKPENGDVRWFRGNVAVDQQSHRALGLAQDITEDKTQDKQREQIIVRVSDAIVKVDANWRFTLVNDRAEEFYEMRETELLGRDFWDVFSEACDTRFEDEYRDVMETREMTAFVEYYSGLDGWYDVRVYPNDDGGLSFYFREIGTHLDHTRGSEERRLIDAALGSLNDVLYVIGPDGDFRWWNDRVLEVTGYTDEELFNTGVINCFPEDEWDRIRASIDETLTTGSGWAEADILTGDGDRIPYQFTGNRVTANDGSTIGIVGTGREITERRDRESRLKALNETGQELMTADTRDAVVEIGVNSACEILDLDANVVSLFDEEHSSLVPVNQTDGARDLIGDPPSLGEASIAWRAFEQGNTRAVDDVRDEPDVHDPATSIRSELFLPIDDYGILIASCRDAGAFDEHDRVLGTILADMIATALDQIKHTETLATQKQELRQQNERLEEFTSVVSHDLRNPLEVASGRLELARGECESDHLDGALNAIDRMNMLIEDLLTLANDGEAVGERETVDFEALVERSWQSVDTEDATLVTDIDRAVEADRSRLQQLLENLLRNAIEHGGSDVTVTVGELADGFYVEDDGPGIPAENRDSVFESGYSTADTGTGFGLSIVTEIVNAHGWHIGLGEETPGGARFEITDVAFTT